MKRFHVHVAVEDLSQSVQFYSTLFATEPSVLKPDYAKWMLDDPRVNFAISRRGAAPGVQHLGIQAEDAIELSEVYDRLQRAERPILNEGATTCCYAKGEKQWIADPQGVAWETFLTHGESTVFGESAPMAKLAAANVAGCCGEPAAAPEKAQAKGCGSAA
jgi:hypothetical protein